MREMTKHRMMTAVILLLTAFCVSTLNAGDLNPPAAPASTMKTLDQVEPRTPVSKADLPLEISKPGSYYLTENIIYDGEGTKTGNAAIAIVCDDVTLDLCGFKLTGAANEKCTAGIYSENRNRITVKNGQVVAFQTYCVHIAGEAADHARIQDIKACNADYPIMAGRNSCVINCMVNYGRMTCISTQFNSMVSGCIVSNTPKSCQEGISVAQHSTVVNCKVEIVELYGIYAGTGCNIIDCTVAQCTKDGIHAMDNTSITGCVVLGTPGATCIHANSECRLEKNTVSIAALGLFMGYGSTARHNQLNDCVTGIDAKYRCSIDNNLIDGSGIGIYAEGHNSIKNNHIVSHMTYGVQVNQNMNVIEHNTIITSDPIVTGIEINGDKNLYMDNRLSNTTNINITGSGNVDGGGNKTF